MLYMASLQSKMYAWNKNESKHLKWICIYFPLWVQLWMFINKDTINIKNTGTFLKINNSVFGDWFWFNLILNFNLRSLPLPEFWTFLLSLWWPRFTNILFKVKRGSKSKHQPKVICSESQIINKNSGTATLPQYQSQTLQDCWLLPEP